MGNVCNGPCSLLFGVARGRGLPRRPRSTLFTSVNLAILSGRNHFDSGASGPSESERTQPRPQSPAGGRGGPGRRRVKSQCRGKSVPVTESRCRDHWQPYRCDYPSPIKSIQRVTSPGEPESRVTPGHGPPESITDSESLHYQ